MNNEFVLVPVLGVEVWVVVMIVIIVLLIAALVALSIYGRKLQKRQESTQKEIEAAAQNVSLLIVDKKRMKLKESGLPQLVIDQTPKYLRGQKVPIVKAKVGPKIMTLICDEKIFELIPVKKSVRATVSGIYITKVQGLRQILRLNQRKLSFLRRLRISFLKTSKGYLKSAVHIFIVSSGFF